VKRLRAAAGYTLVEVLAVCALLSVVLTGVIAVMVGGSHAELQLNKRFTAQNDGRLALTVLRSDAHIACAVTVSADKKTAWFSVPTVNRSTNPVTQPTPTTQCGRTDAGNNLTKVTWCVLTSPTNSTRFALYRSTTSTCTSASKFQADSLVNNLAGFNGYFNTQSQIPSGQLQTVTVDLPINPKSGTTGRPYDLTQTIALRNTVWTTSSTPVNCAAAAPCTFGLCTAVGCYAPLIS
jgi:Tfp pilus assembly protein PilW